MSILLNGIRAAFPPRLKAAWQPHMITILQNRLSDNIGSKKLISELRFYDLPQTYKWICDWNINVDGKDVKTIQTVEQHFFYDWIDVVNEIATTTVSKFNCSVSRSTEKNNKHLFINQSK